MCEINDTTSRKFAKTVQLVVVVLQLKENRVWPRVEFPSDFDEGQAPSAFHVLSYFDEGPVARNLIDCAKTVTAVVLHA